MIAITIVEVIHNKRDYLPLLLLADEQESMVERYLERGTMYALDDDGIKAVCIVTDEGNQTLEIKNIVTKPEYQKKGYGRTLIEFLIHTYSHQYKTLLVGTGDSPLTIPFYEKCGFHRSHVIPNFFLEHYDHPIWEEGCLLTDMIYLKMELKETKFFK